jgi:hypothetical protein
LVEYHHLTPQFTLAPTALQGLVKGTVMDPKASFNGPPLDRFMPNPKLRFLDQCREVMRKANCLKRTEVK